MSKIVHAVDFSPVPSEIFEVGHFCIFSCVPNLRGIVIRFGSVINSYPPSEYNQRTIPLLDPGVLNCDESRILRGVDKLLTSNTGIGDVSLALELCGK